MAATMPVNRHLLIVVLSALLPLLLVAGVLAYVLVHNERRNTESALQHSAQRLAQALDAELARSFAALEVMSRSNSLRRGDLRTFYVESVETRDALGLWDNVLLLSPQADHVLNLMRPYGEPLPPVPQSEGTLTAAQTRKPYVSNVLRGRIETDWLIYIAYPAIHDGEVRYVIGATMSARYWTRWLQAHAPPGMAAGVIDRDHRLLTRTTDAETAAGQPVQAWYGEVLAASDGSGQARGMDLSRTDVVTAFHRSELSGWHASVFTPGAQLDAPMRRVAGGVSSAVVAALLIAVGLATTRARVIERAHRQSESLLRDSEEKFRTIAHAAPAIVWTTDEHGITFINERWHELTGQPTAQALGQGWTACVHPDDHARLLPLRGHARRSGEPYIGEIRYRAQDGEYRWHVFRALPGGSQQWFGVAVDVHDARQAREALREADRRKDEFLATLAHELRNPLAPIRNALHLLNRRGVDDAQARAAREMMERQVKHMVRLIDDLLDVSRITRGRLELRREPVELARVVDQALETVRPHLAQQLTVSLPPQPVHLDADPVRLSQVLANLLNNAAKYTPRTGHIALSAALEGSTVAIRVRDDGIGIAAEQLPNLFRMFSQAISALEHSRGGLGIGLALARSLVQLHGGTIEARSGGPGRGSEFTVRLPVVAPPARAPDPVAQPAAACSGATRRILVVDDVTDSVESMAALLRLDGHEVVTAADGLQAVAQAEAFRPELILLDIGLPKLDGLEACRRIRSQPWGQGIVIAALTGWGQEADRARSSDAGFDTHLVKPVSLDAVRELLVSRLV
jgi:PAS domain S-box-containing protein